MTKEEAQKIVDDVAAGVQPETGDFRDHTIGGRRLYHAVPGVEIRKGATKPSSGKLLGPSRLELLALATKRLLKLFKGYVAPPGAEGENQALTVGATIDLDTEQVFIYPWKGEGLPIPIGFSNGKAYLNLDHLLFPTKRQRESGYEETYDIFLADPATSPVGPALYFVLNQPLSRKAVSKKRAAKAAPAPDTPR